MEEIVELLDDGWDREGDAAGEIASPEAILGLFEEGLQEEMYCRLVPDGHVTV